MNKGLLHRYSIYDIQHSAGRFFILLCLLIFTGCAEQVSEPEPVVVVEEQEQALILVDEPASEAAELVIEEALPEVPVAPQYTLTYTAGDHGFLDGDSTQIVEEGGHSRPVTAVGEEGYHFVEWSDGSTANPRSDGEVTADIAVTANFAINQYSLTYTAQGNGSIDGVGPQTVAHGADGGPVTAVPAENHHFLGWSDGITTAVRRDSKVTGDIAVSANFAINQYRLAYLAGDNGFIEGAKSQRVDHGGAGTAVTAFPAAGYHFVGWSDGLKTARRSDRDVTADFTVTAEFAVNRYTLNYAAGEHGTIEGATPQVVEHGADAEAVLAVADRGYHFTGWSDGVEAARRVDREVAGDLAVSALFAVNTYTVGGSVSGLIETTEVVLRNNDGDDIRITADGSFKFAGELLDTEPYLVTVLTQPFSPNQTCTVAGGSGTISEADITDIEVICVINSYTIGGTIFGLPEDDRIILQNNGTDDLVIDADGDFIFALPLDDHSVYEVAIHSQVTRPNWTCEVENGAGTLAGRDVTDLQVTCFVEAVLQAAAGMNQIELSWNSHDFSGVTFNLCRAREDFSSGEFGECRKLWGTMLETGVSSSHIASRLLNDVTYWFQLEVRHGSGFQTYSEVVAATPFGGLNDTGIDWCGDDSRNRFMSGTRLEKSTSCETLEASHPRQDGYQGRDAAARSRTLIKVGSGAAGFDLTKICASGEAAGAGRCPPNPMLGEGPNNWACTRDNVTGLLWEVKTESGRRGASHTYSWYNPNRAGNGGEPGQPNGGSCAGTNCDTHAYVRVVNDLGLCGTTDWRLPTRKELLSIVDNGRYDPAIDTNFFPHAVSSNYWSSSPYADQGNSAWQIYFHYGEAYPNDKKQANHVRLVQGRTVTFGFNNP